VSHVCIKGAAVLADGVRPAAIYLDPDSGTIISVEEIRRAECPEVLVFPGFVDIHVHAREYPIPREANPEERSQWEAVCRKETFQTAGEAAINGGVTMLAAMPNDPIPPDNPETYERKKRLASKSPCPIALFACVTRDSEPWADLPYKVYLDSAPSRVSFHKWRDLETTLARYTGCRVFFHAEDPEILQRHENQGPRWRSRPPEAEFRAVERILELTARYGLKTHMCHVSTQRALELLIDYNAHAADRITCEATPHHLFFSVSDGVVRSAAGGSVPAAPLLECNPPLRFEEDRLSLLAALKDGQVDALATDHAPHTLDDKMRGAAGMPHLDTAGAFVGWLINECGFLPERIAEVFSAAPARIIAQEVAPRQGKIEPSWLASLTVLDLNAKTKVDGSNIEGRGTLKTRCGWSPFEGISLPARVQACVVRGEQILFP
jgi:dihydroorotase